MPVCCFQLQYILTLDVVGSAWSYYHPAGEIIASTCREEAIGGMCGEDRNSITDMKFVIRPGRKCDIGRQHWEVKRFQ